MSIKRSIEIGAGKKTAKKTKTKVTIKSKMFTDKSKKKKTANVKNIKTMRPKEPREFVEDGPVLIIVESPAKSKTIEKFLGPNYKVKASMGHLRDLPSSQLGVDVDDNFKVRYANLARRRTLIKELRELADKSSRILLATDPDREGEAISWHLAYILNLDEKDLNRIAFNEITKTAVKGALENPRTINMDMVNAQQARRVLDRLVGYKLSPLLWKKICKGLSAGRVQSVAVRLICEREREIQAFEPVEYWTVNADYLCEDTKGKKHTIEAELVQIDGAKANIENEEQALKIKEDISKEDAEVISVKKRKRSKKPNAPYTTSTMQQDAASRIGFGAKKTMLVAQHLYEGIDAGEHGHVGLITYMRTDSTRISNEIQAQAKDYIIDTYGEEYYPSKPNIYGSKESAQDAHEAIRPTSLELTPEILEKYLEKDELRLYTLIWNRFLASQMTNEERETLTIEIGVKNYKLRASGSVLLFKGFAAAYNYNKDKDKILPNLEEGQVVNNDDVESKQHFTQPPARYSESSLIKMLEEKGIGRPSTYAPIMDTILARNYVEKENKTFIPTELGFIVIDFLVKHFESIVNVNFTAKLEAVLDEVAEGKMTYEEVLGDFYTEFDKELKKGAEAESIELPVEESGELCDLCGSPMIYKLGRYGKFLACSSFPECSNTKQIVKTIGVQCPKCKEGEMAERKSKRGRTFYGCERFPACDFMVWEKPINEFCETCGSIMTEKTYKNGKTKKSCSNIECPAKPKRKPRAKKAEKDTKETKEAVKEDKKEEKK